MFLSYYCNTLVFLSYHCVICFYNISFELLKCLKVLEESDYGERLNNMLLLTEIGSAPAYSVSNIGGTKYWENQVQGF